MTSTLHQATAATLALYPSDVLCDALEQLTAKGGEPQPTGIQLQDLTDEERAAHTALVEELEIRYLKIGLDEHLNEWVETQPDEVPLSAPHATEIVRWVRDHLNRHSTHT